MAGFIQKLYAKVYINIIVEKDYALIYVTVGKMGRTLEKDFKRFELENGELTREANAYIEDFERRSPFSYISVLNTTLEQGAQLGCSKDALKDKVWQCVSSKGEPWSVFVDPAILRGIQKQFKYSGLDYIFSPFSLMAISTKEIHKGKVQLFSLVLEKALSIAVFKNGLLVFARQYSLDESENEFDLDEDDLMLESNLTKEAESMDLNVDLNLDLESNDEVMESLDELEGLDDLDGLDGLDELEEMDELADLNDLGDDEAISEFTEATPEVIEPEEDTTSLSGFSRNFRRFELIQDAIHEFYRGSDINSAFIEDVYLLDPYNDCSDLTAYLEDELYVTVHFRELNLDKALLALAKGEIKNAS